MKFNGPKVKLSRALGIALTPKSRRYMENRPYPPGQHGPSRRGRGKFSAYKRQLLEKQRLRAQYNIHERQMRKYFLKASGRRENTADTLIQLLESRLDAVVMRGGLARTIYAARQYVRHGHILVNGKPLDIPSAAVRPGDEVTVKDTSRKLPCFHDALDTAGEIPPYLHLDKEGMKIQLVYLPPRDEVPVLCEMPQVIEYYSK